MLKARLISAAIMVPLVVCGVLLLSAPVFSLILAVIMLLAVWEWSHLIPVTSILTRGIYTAAIAALMWLLWQSGLEQNIYPLLLLAFVWWLCALFWLTRPQICAAASPLTVNLKMLVGILVIVPGMGCTDHVARKRRARADIDADVAGRGLACRQRCVFRRPAVGQDKTGAGDQPGKNPGRCVRGTAVQSGVCRCGGWSVQRFFQVDADVYAGCRYCCYVFCRR